MTTPQKFARELTDDQFAELLDEFRLSTGESNIDTVRRWLFKMVEESDPETATLDLEHEFVFFPKDNNIDLIFWADNPATEATISVKVRWNAYTGFSFSEVAIHEHTESGDHCDFSPTGHCKPHYSEGGIRHKISLCYPLWEVVHITFSQQGFNTDLNEIKGAFEVLELYIKEGMPT